MYYCMASRADSDIGQTWSTRAILATGFGQLWGQFRGDAWQMSPRFMQIKRIDNGCSQRHILFRWHIRPSQGNMDIVVPQDSQVNIPSVRPAQGYVPIP